MTHSVGCLPKRCHEALQQTLFEPWKSQGGDAWNSWLTVIERFRESLAGFLGGRAVDYCPQANLSSGLAKLLAALPKPTSRKVLLAAEDSFPSLAFALQGAAKFGFETQLIPRLHDPSVVASWAQALTADVAAALVTHVHSNTGVVAPVAEIAALCRERGIFCIVDIAQSAGILPLSVAEFAADAVLGSCVKWLCGGPGAGFMWINPARVQDLLPTDVGWFSHADPFEFDVHSFRYAPDARRFWGGTPSIAPYAIAAESVRVLAGIGIRDIRAHNSQLIEGFRTELPRRWRSEIDAARIGGTICLPLGGALDEVRRALQANAVRVDYRGAAVRLSFHIYNTAEEAAFIAHCWASAA